MEIINRIKNTVRKLFRGVVFSNQSEKSIYRTRSVKDGEVTYDYHEITNEDTNSNSFGLEEKMTRETEQQLADSIMYSPTSVYGYYRPCKGLIDGAEDQTQQTISGLTLPDMSVWQDRFDSISRAASNFDLESCNTIESNEHQEDKPSYKPPNRQAFGPLFRKKGQRY